MMFVLKRKKNVKIYSQIFQCKWRENTGRVDIVVEMP